VNAVQTATLHTTDKQHITNCFAMFATLSTERQCPEPFLITQLYNNQ